MLKKVLLILTLMIVSMTMLNVFSASAENTKISRAKIAKLESTKPGQLKLKIKKVKNCTGYIVKLSQNKSFLRQRHIESKVIKKQFLV